MTDDAAPRAFERADGGRVAPAEDEAGNDHERRERALTTAPARPSELREGAGR